MNKKFKVGLIRVLTTEDEEVLQSFILIRNAFGYYLQFREIFHNLFSM